MPSKFRSYLILALFYLHLWRSIVRMSMLCVWRLILCNMIDTNTCYRWLFCLQNDGTWWS